MKKSYWPWVIVVVALLALMFTVQTCKYYANSATNWQGKYDYQVQVTDSFKNSKGVTVIEQKPAIFTNDAELKKISAEIFDLKNKNERLVKKVEMLVSTTQQIKITDELIPFDSGSKADDYFDANDSMVNKNTVIVPPMPFNKSSKDYFISGNVLLSGVKIDSFLIHNTITWRLIEKKTGLFKRALEVQAINSNKYFDNTGMKSAVVVKQKTAWDKWIKPVIGFAAGIFVGNKLN